MKVLAILAALSATALAADFKWKSCGNDKDVVVTRLVVSPDPVTFPGKVSYELDADLKKDVKGVSMVLKIVRNTFLDIAIPCAKQIGSCSYSRMCSFVDDMIAEDWGNIGKKVGPQIKQLLAKKGSSANFCSTGIKAQTIRASGSIDVPELPSLLSFFAAGDYTVRVELTDTNDNTQLACIEAKAKLSKKGSSGSFWGKRRRSLDLF